MSVWIKTPVTSRDRKIVRSFWDLTEEIVLFGARGVTCDVAVPGSLSGAIARTSGHRLKTRTLSKLLTELGYVKWPKPIRWLGSQSSVWVKPGIKNEHEILKCLNETLKST